MKTDFITNKFDDLLDEIIDYRQKKSKTPWYDNIINNLMVIHKRNPNNEIFHKLIQVKDKDYLLYMVVYNDMYIDIKVYIPELKDCFLLKMNCKINRTLLSIYELVLEDLDKVSKFINSEIFTYMLNEIEDYCSKNKILAVNIYANNFVAPYNKEIEILTKNLDYRLINTNIGTSLYKDIKPKQRQEF